MPRQVARVPSMDPPRRRTMGRMVRGRNLTDCHTGAVKHWNYEKNFGFIEKPVGEQFHGDVTEAH